MEHMKITIEKLLHEHMELSYVKSTLEGPLSSMKKTFLHMMFLNKTILSSKFVGEKNYIIHLDA